MLQFCLRPFPFVILLIGLYYVPTVALNRIQFHLIKTDCVPVYRCITFFDTYLV